MYVIVCTKGKNNNQRQSYKQHVFPLFCNWADFVCNLPDCAGKNNENGVSKSSISKWCAEFREEYQIKAQLNPDSSMRLLLWKKISDGAKNQKMQKKENLFLKKVALFFVKEIDYRLIGL